MKSKKHYETKDLYEGSFLLAYQQKLLGLKKENKYYWFIFQNRIACEKLSSGYWAGTVQVNAKNYSDAIRTLKDRLFSQK